MNERIQRIVSAFTQSDEDRAVEGAASYGTILMRARAERDQAREAAIHFKAQSDAKDRTIERLEADLRRADQRNRNLANSLNTAETELRGLLHFALGVDERLSNGRQIVADYEAERPRIPHPRPIPHQPPRPVTQARIDHVAPRPAPAPAPQAQAPAQAPAPQEPNVAAA